MLVTVYKKYTVSFASETLVTVGGINRYIKSISINEQSDNGDPYRIGKNAGDTADGGDYVYVGSDRPYDVPASGSDTYSFYVRLDQNVGDKAFTVTTVYRS